MIASRGLARVGLIALLSGIAALGLSCLEIEASGFKCSATDGATGGECPPPFECRQPQNRCYRRGEDAGTDATMGAAGTGGSVAGRGGGGTAGTSSIGGAGGRGGTSAIGGAGGTGASAGMGGVAGTAGSAGSAGTSGGTTGTPGSGGTGTAGTGTAGTAAAGSGGTSGRGGAGGSAGTGTSGRGGGGASGTGVAGTVGTAGRGGNGGTGGTSGSGGMPGSKPIGMSCGATAECVTGATCVEGVCCSSACAGTCMSCRNANTNAAEGTCAAVKAGATHGSDCAASDASTCGLDGTCNGAGACRRHVSGTVCRSAMCPAGTTTFSPVSTCDGNGSCVAGNTSSCANYSCNAGAAMCRTTCAGAADCASTAYCSGTSCVAKKSAGVVCGGNTECASGTCGGRCCNTGASCTCPQPSAGNLIRNPGFDTDLSSWTITSGDGTIVWGSADATSCPFSGSAFISTNSEASPRISQCVPVSPSQSTLTTRYYWGLRARNPIGCDIDWYVSPNCTGSPNNLMNTTVWLNVGWSTISPAGSVDVDLAASSVRISCYVSPDAPGASGYVDNFFFSLTDGPF